jgi:exodeoxyribonuclease VII large subunit
MPFNNELLVREVSSFPVPVIAGIGHDKDEPLVALAADASESTPTAVANLLNESWEQAFLLLERYERDIVGRYETILDNYKEVENELRISLSNFKNALLNAKIRIEDSLDKSLSGFRLLLSKVNQRVIQAEKAVFFNNPERQLRLGYSIARCDGKIIRKIGDTKIGENMDVRVIDGVIVSEVKNIKQQKYD